MKYLHNFTRVQIFCMNSDFIDVSYLSICGGFETLESQMQSTAPSAVHPYKIFVELHGTQAASTKAFRTALHFFHRRQRGKALMLLYRAVTAVTR